MESCLSESAIDLNAPLNILHIYRAPVGGLFRHVLDLARTQIARGHRVGMVADSLTGGSTADEILRELEPSLALGLTRIPMRRHIGPGDLPALLHVTRRVAETKADVAHGHGAKGGAFARMALGSRRALRAYTPHGGSLLYGHDTMSGRFYLATERFLMLCGDLFLFESAYSAEIFRHKIGTPKGLVRIVHNGVTRAEFAPIETAADATDLVFIGELRPVKGVDILIDALAELRGHGRAVTATLVGDGPDRAALQAQVDRLGLADLVHFAGAMPAREAQKLGRIMVIPSLAESLPYVVLETVAAGMPLITTNVGGIPEIYGPRSDCLVEPRDPGALARAIAQAIDHPDATAALMADLRERVAQSFSVDSMVEGVLAAYRDGLEKLRLQGRR
ncbi:MAG TPA: glycosyltransferase family 4 protein [Pseudolabrys sp.]|nr:glycosyltransferase family 4 protein [Pseudolabrys sp.]